MTTILIAIANLKYAMEAIDLDAPIAIVVSSNYQQDMLCQALRNELGLPPHLSYQQVHKTEVLGIELRVESQP